MAGEAGVAFFHVAASEFVEMISPVAAGRPRQRGLGLVEGSLTVTLIAAGGGGTLVLAAVLLYRIVSYWGTLPFGLLGYVAVRRAHLAGSTSLDADGDRAPTIGDRASGGDRPLLVLEG